MQGISSNKEDLSGEVAHKTTALWHDLNIDNSEATGVSGHALRSSYHPSNFFQRPRDQRALDVPQLSRTRNIGSLRRVGGGLRCCSERIRKHSTVRHNYPRSTRF